MVGSEKSGYSSCHDRLIENAYYFLTPTKKVPQEKVTELDSFIEELGAMTIHLDAEDHDRFTAGISHVPHLIACELVHQVAKIDTKDGILKQLAAGGFKDITRIASSSPEVWEQIIISNQSARPLYEQIEEQIKNDFRMKPEYEAMRKRYFRSTDHTHSRQICECIKNLL